MTSKHALLTNIIEHPDDDAPRLIYADYLEEHGDPDRAEFIRLADNPISTIDLGALAALLRSNPELQISLKGCPLPKRLRKEIAGRFPRRVAVDQSPSQASVRA